MEVKSLSIPDVLLIKNKVFRDERGFFEETFKASVVEEFNLSKFVQDNHSRSNQGVLRGLHYQVHPWPVAKLVRCMQGEIFDVAVDIRPDSPTFKQWVGVYLNGDSGKALYVPEGFAHGFCVISDTAEVAYKVSTYYTPECERIIRWDDPDINIAWPIESVVLSDKDANAPLLKDAEL